MLNANSRRLIARNFPVRQAATIPYIVVVEARFLLTKYLALSHSRRSKFSRSVSERVD